METALEGSYVIIGAPTGTISGKLTHDTTGFPFTLKDAVLYKSVMVSPTQQAMMAGLAPFSVPEDLIVVESGTYWMVVTDQRAIEEIENQYDDMISQWRAQNAGIISATHLPPTPLRKG